MRSYHDPSPLYLVRGEGCRVTDADGVERLDFINNYIELIRFANSGTEATMLAIRAARAFTGRTTIGVFAGGYHGSHDWGVSIPADPVVAPGGAGVPAAVAGSIVVAPYNDVDATRAALEPHLHDLAAVVVEPVLGAGGVIPADGGFLSFLRELTEEAGALLVFDEVIAFRVGYNGAQGRYGVTPDLTTLGKIIGGGLPVGAFGGRADVMELFDPRSGRRLSHGGTFKREPALDGPRAWRPSPSRGRMRTSGSRPWRRSCERSSCASSRRSAGRRW